MRSVIGASDHRPKEEVVSHKHDHTAQRSGQGGAWQGKLAQIKRCDQSPRNPKNRPGSAHAQDGGIPNQTREACRQTGDQVHRGKRPVAVDRFRQSAEAPETPHVEADVQQAAVNENASQQPPPLATDGQGPKICSPAHKILARRIVEHRNARQCHGDEHRNIDAKDCLRDRHRTGLRPQPGRGFNSLDGGTLAALRRLMLHAPLAKLLAETESWKLTTALNASCHLDADYHVGYLDGGLCESR